MLTAGTRPPPDHGKLIRESINNTPECPLSTPLCFSSTPNLHTALHGSLYFLTPGMVAWRRLRCNNLQDAIPILHRLEIDYEPGGGDPEIRYQSRYPQWDVVEDVVKRDRSAALVGTAWNQERVGAGGGEEKKLLAAAVKPAIPMGALIDRQQRVTVMAECHNVMRTVDTDTMEPAGDISLDEVCGVEGWRLAGEPLIDLTGRWTCLFAEPTTSDERQYKVIEYGPGPNPRPSTLAVFKAPTAADWVDCFTKTADNHYIVGFTTNDALLFILLRPKHGMTAVYQSDAARFVKIVNTFSTAHGDHLFIDAVVSDTQRPRDCLGCDDICALRARLTRYTLAGVKEEEARFDGAAGQLHGRFPTATRHSLSDAIVDGDVQCAPVVGREPYRFAYGRCLSKENVRVPLYNALCKVDCVERHRKACEWSAPDCFPSPVALIQQHHHSTTTTTTPSLSSPTTSPTSNTLKAWSDTVVKLSRSAYPQQYAHEDDLLVVSVVRDVVAGRSFVVFVDGQDMVEAGRVELPIAVPVGLSAPLWVPRDS